MIKVGAATETELKEKKHRIEDALSATRAAVEEGIVAGGGVTLVNIIPTLDQIEAEGDELVGVRIVRRALEEPMRQIAENAGMEGSVVVEKIKESKPGVGFNALDEEVRGHDPGRNRRPAEGDPQRAAERRQHRLDAADHRGPGLRDPAEEG